MSGPEHIAVVSELIDAASQAGSITRAQSLKMRIMLMVVAELAQLNGTLQDGAIQVRNGRV